MTQQELLTKLDDLNVGLEEAGRTIRTLQAQTQVLKHLAQSQIIKAAGDRNLPWAVKPKEPDHV